MSAPENQTCCRRCISFIFSSGLAVVIIWLFYFKVTSPTCSIEDFYASALNKSDISTPAPPHNNHTLISYDLKLKNRNRNKGVYYDTLNVTFYYYTTTNNNNKSSLTIGNSSFAPFYQGHHKSTHRYGRFEPRGVVWESGFSNVSQNGSTPVFRVELATAVRYKNVFWKTKRHRLVVKADLKVNDLGNLVRVKKNKGIKLSDGAPPMIQGSLGIFGTFLLSVFVFIHFC